MRRVVLESPFAGDPTRNIAYGRACLQHSLSLGEAPMAMHLLYTQPGVLDDTVPWQRTAGMEAAFAWYESADACVVYRDYGVSKGMEAGMHLASQLGLPIEMRMLPHWPPGVSPYFFDPFPDGRMMTARQMIERS